MIRLLCLALAAILCTAATASADELRPGYLELTQRTEQGWSLIWKAPMRSGVTPNMQPILPDGCKAQGQARRVMNETAVLSTFDLVCSGPVAGHSIGLANFSAAQTDVLVRVAPLGRPVQVLRLTPDQPLAEIAVRPDRWQIAWSYFGMGVEHILFGYDHLLFVVALVLLLNRLRPIAIAVTAFTAAHSLTLVGTTLGYFTLPQRPVEAVIALSIVFLAVEIVKKTDDAPGLTQRLPWVVAFIFGLLHGFGFAGALKEIGLPESDVPTALVTFNLGVEAGQLAIVGGTLLTLWAVRSARPHWSAPATRAASYSIGTIGAMWLFQRVLL